MVKSMKATVSKQSSVPAQVAKQQGEYLSAMLGSGKIRPGQPIPPDTPPFRFIPSNRESLVTIALLLEATTHGRESWHA